MLKIDLATVVEIIGQAKPAPGMLDNKEWCSGCESARQHIAGSIADILQANNKDFDRQEFMKHCLNYD